MPRIIKTENGDELRKAVSDAARSLSDGQLVGFPDSTSYAIAARSDREEAVARLRELSSGPLRLAISEDETAAFVDSESRRLRTLTGRCWPGPLVVQVPKSAVTTLPEPANEAVSEDGLVQVIAPSGDAARLILADVDAPLVVLTESVSEVITSADEIVKRFGDDVDLIIDDGPPMFESPATVVRSDGTELTVVFSGILSEQAINISSCQIYLFVCTGNTCRSPLAEGLFRKLLADRLGCGIDELVRNGYLVQSAGLAAASGGSASYESVELLQRRGIDMASHSSQPLSETLLTASNHIFTMTNGHRDAILRYRADLADKVEVLRRDGSDVVDPIGGGMVEYQRCEREIEESLRAIIGSHFG